MRRRVDTPAGSRHAPAPAAPREAAGIGLLVASAAVGSACQIMSGTGEMQIQQIGGAACTAAIECVSGHCVDGVCCDRPCPDVCWTCADSPTPGTCAPVPAGDDPDGECDPGSSCNGSGRCYGSEMSAVSLPRPGVGEELGQLSVDRSGSVVLTGRWSKEPGNTDTDGFVTELDARGNVNWQGSFGEQARQLGDAVAHDPFDGAAFVVGRFEGPMDFASAPFDAPGEPQLPSGCASAGSGFPHCALVARLKGNGQYEWGWAFGAVMSSVAFRALGSVDREADPSGGVVVGGELEGTVDFGTAGSIASSGGDDVLVARFDVDGTLQWAAAYGDVLDQTLAAIALDPRIDQRSFVIAGGYAGELDLGGDPLGAAAERNIFVAKRSLANEHVWSNAVAVSGGAAIDGLAIDSLGNVVVAGTVDGQVDFGDGVVLEGEGKDLFVAQLASDGRVAWGRSFAASGDLSVAGVAVDAASGHRLIAGSFGNEVDFGGGALAAQGSDVYVLRLDGSGQHVWSGRLGGPDNEHARGMALDAGHGEIVVGGDFNGTLPVGEGQLQTDGSPDVFVARFAAD